MCTACCLSTSGCKVLLKHLVEDEELCDSHQSRLSKAVGLTEEEASGGAVREAEEGRGGVCGEGGMARGVGDVQER